MDTERKIVFLVDDNMTNLAVGKKALTGFYKVFTLISGEIMFNMLENIRPHLILLDIKMPEMDGYQVLQKLRSDPQTADIPVIFLTSLDEVEDAGIGCIRKPFTPESLLARVDAEVNP